MLPRDHALTKPSGGLLGALNTWLRSTGQMLISGFMVKKKRRPAPPTTLRERVELTQLRAENRRLRSQLEGMVDLRGPGLEKGNVLSRADRAEREKVGD